VEYKITGQKKWVALLSAMVVLLLSTAVMSESAVVTKGSKAADMNSCIVDSTDIMRRNHMEFLKHDRDETVRKGVRDTKASLAECVDCHAAKDEHGKHLPVNAEGQFCESCHHYAAVSVSCFQCHRTVPEDN
jgi:cytochrome c553